MLCHSWWCQCLSEGCSFCTLRLQMFKWVPRYALYMVHLPQWIHLGD